MPCRPLGRTRHGLRSRHTTLAALGVAAGLLVASAPGNALAQQGGPSAASGGTTSFSSSFESGEPAPDWTNTLETLPDGTPKAAGVDGAQAAVDTGPTSSPTARTNAGFTGAHALYYGGEHRAADRAYA